GQLHLGRRARDAARPVSPDDGRGADRVDSDDPDLLLPPGHVRPEHRAQWIEGLTRPFSAGEVRSPPTEKACPTASRGALWARRGQQAEASRVRARLEVSTGMPTLVSSPGWGNERYKNVSWLFK